MTTLNTDILKQHLRYVPETGEFWWILANRRRNLQKPAGTLRKTGYVAISIQGTIYLAHRLAWLYMTGEWPDNEIDHINGDPGDNRWSNLRPATPHENQQNRSVSKNNKTGYPGVIWVKRAKCYIALLTLQYERYQIGGFTNPEDAYIAYWLMKQKLHTFNPSVRI